MSVLIRVQAWELDRREHLAGLHRGATHHGELVDERVDRRDHPVTSPAPALLVGPAGVELLSGPAAGAPDGDAAEPRGTGDAAASGTAAGARRALGRLLVRGRIGGAHPSSVPGRARWAVIGGWLVGLRTALGPVLARAASPRSVCAIRHRPWGRSRARMGAQPAVRERPRPEGTITRQQPTTRAALQHS